MAAEAETPIVARTITVRTGRLVCEVAIADSRYRTTDGQLARVVAEAFPNITRHACVNGKGSTFGAVIACTSVPHLLEHVAIDLQTQAATDDAATFVGTTEWVDEAAGTACIQLSFADDLVALRAFRDALVFLNDAVLALRHG